MKVADALLPEYDNEMATTRRVLERAPEDKFGWKPHDKSWTLGQLATHLATIPSWAVPTVQQDSLNVAGAPSPAAAASRAELLSTFDKNAADGRAAIASAQDERWADSWSLVAGERTIFSLPRLAVLRGFVLNHHIHHRGQLSVYLRLNDALVPSIYGPSADETGM